MSLRLAKTPWLLKRAFSSYAWNIKTSEKVLYLTFDDGPTPKVTEQVLAILKKYNAKATFFCIGNNITKHPEIFNYVLKEGHAIGNHTYDHLKGWETNTTNYIENVLKAETAIQQINKSTNQQKLFRPPYGRIKPGQARQLQKQDYKIIMWDVLSFDWDKKVAKKKVLKNVLDNARLGSIIVFHDSEKATENMLYALPKVLKYFSKKGFKFEALTKEL